MDTQYWLITDPDDPRLEEAGRILREGGLVAFPTETVYGLGANGLDEQAVAGIYEAKRRPGDNPLILHVSSTEEAKALASFPDGSSAWSEKAAAVAEAFWPGPLSMVLPAASYIPRTVTAGLDTVAIRCPADSIARALIHAAGVPVAAPSANTSGKPSPTQGSHVLEDMDGRIDLILDGGPCKVGIESTIIDLSVEPPVILRPGDITRDALCAVLGEIRMEGTLEIGQEQSPAQSFQEQQVEAQGARAGAGAAVQEAEKPEQTPKAPGLKYRHYAPNAPMIILSGEVQSVAAYIQEQAAFQEAGQPAKGDESMQQQSSISEPAVEGMDLAWAQKKLGLLLSRDTWDGMPGLKSRLESQPQHYLCRDMGSRKNPWEMGSVLYEALRACNQGSVDMILVEACQEQGQGAAVYNRLWKAAGGKVLYLSEDANL